MTRKWWWASALGTALLAAGGAWFWSRDSPATLAVVDRLFAHDPVEIASDAAAVTSNDSALVMLAARAGRLWTAADMGTWTRVNGPTGLMLRSPALDLDAADEIEALVIHLTPAAHADGLRILWSEAAVPTWGDYGRSRRELQPQSDGPATVIVRGSVLHGDRSGMPRHLFLAPADRAAAAVASLAVVTLAERVANARAARTRVTAAGDTRDAFFLRTPGRLAWRVVPHQGAELQLGVCVPAPDTAVRLRIEASSGGRDMTLYDGPARSPVPPALQESPSPPSSPASSVSCRLPGWYDLRLPLTMAEPGTVRVSIDGGGAGVAYVSEPTILAHAEPTYPNVVLIVVDSLRADHLGAYGAARVTPFLDRFARESLVFDHAYSAAAWTKPAVASLLTGFYPATHGVGGRYYSDQLPGRVRTLQGELRASGYVTAQFSGTAFTGSLSNIDRDFDQALGPAAFADGRQKVDTEALNTRLLPWIDAHRHDRFFVYVHAVDAQRPYASAAAAQSASEARAYDASVRHVDDEIARVYDQLTRLDLARRTLFIVTADHGDAFGDHGQRGHGQSVYDEEVRVPLIVHWPDRIPPGRSSVPVTHVDLMPTVLDYAGVPPVATGVEGRSVAERGESARPSPIFVTRFTYPDDTGGMSNRTNVDAVIDYPWKLIASGGSGEAARLELFNLGADPGELTNLAPRERERAARLAATLRQFLQERALARTRFLAAYGG